MSRDYSIWAVYDHPDDFPNWFIARRFEYDHGVQPTDEIMMAPTLALLREELIMLGLTPLSRSEEDDPKIVESWI